MQSATTLKPHAKYFLSPSLAIRPVISQKMDRGPLRGSCGTWYRMLAFGCCQSNALAPCQIPGAKGICGFVNFILKGWYIHKWLNKILISFIFCKGNFDLIWSFWNIYVLSLCHCVPTELQDEYSLVNIPLAVSFSNTCIYCKMLLSCYNIENFPLCCSSLSNTFQS